MTRATVRNFPQSFLYSAVEGDESWGLEATQLSPGGHEFDVGSVIDGVADVVLGGHDSIAFDGPAVLGSSRDSCATGLSDPEHQILLDMRSIERSSLDPSSPKTNRDSITSGSHGDVTPCFTHMSRPSPAKTCSMIIGQDSNMTTSGEASHLPTSRLPKDNSTSLAVSRSNTHKSRSRTINSACCSGHRRHRESHIGLHSATVEAIQIAEQDSPSEPESLGEEFVMVANTPQRPRRSTESLDYDNHFAQSTASLYHEETPLIQASAWVASATQRARENPKALFTKRPSLRRMGSSRSNVDFASGHTRTASKSTVTSTERTSFESSSSMGTLASSMSPTSAAPEGLEATPLVALSTSSAVEARGRSFRRQRKTSISDKARHAFAGFKTRMSSVERIVQCKPYGLIAAPRPAAPQRAPTHPLITTQPAPPAPVHEPLTTSVSRPMTIASFVAGKESQCTTPVFSTSRRSNADFDGMETCTNNSPVSGNSAFSALEAAMEELSKTIAPSGNPLGGANDISHMQSREPISDIAGATENAEKIFSTLMIETSEMSHLVVASGSTARRARVERRPSYATLLRFSDISGEQKNSDRVTLWLDRVEQPHAEDDVH